METVKKAGVSAVGFLVGAVMGIAFLWVFTGCGEDNVVSADVGVDVVVTPAKPDVTPAEPDLTPMPPDVNPAQACRDIVQWLYNKVMKCTDGDVAQAEEFKKVIEAAWDCPNVVGVRDAVAFYKVCQVKIRDLTCVDFNKSIVPESCQTQLQ